MIDVAKRSNPMKPVTQEDPMGCGIACVAFICGVSYKKAKKLFTKPENAATGRGYWYRDLVKALARAGKMYDFSRLNNVRVTRYAEGSIVFTKRSKTHPFGHYLACAGTRKRKVGVWMDPWVNYPKMTPARSGFVNRLPDKAIYYVFQTTEERKGTRVKRRIRVKRKI